MSFVPDEGSAPTVARFSEVKSAGIGESVTMPPVTLTPECGGKQGLQAQSEMD